MITMELLGRLKDAAFHACPAPQANAELARVRQERVNRCGRAVAYEIVATPSGTLDPALLPRLAVHLEAKRVPLTCCPELFAGVFAGDTLYFVEGKDLVEALLAHAGLRASEVPGYVAAWQAAQADRDRLKLPALPPPSSSETDD